MSSCALAAAAQNVLETMFFTPAEPVPAPPSIETPIRALVQFDGDMRGAFILAVEHRAALALASAFLGIDAAGMTAEQVREVVSEAANVICGAALSLLERDGHFSLAPPVILSAEADPPEPSIGEWLTTPEGVLRASMHLD